ncbi:MAG TPA: STAS domain-containing protein [Acidimicrobiia bacterium]
MDGRRSWVEVRNGDGAIDAASGSVRADVVIDVRGDLDVEHASSVVECVRRALADPATATITIDMGEAAFVDEAAVDGLVRAKRLSLERAVPLRVRAVSTRGRRLLELLQLDGDLLDG